MNYESGLGAKPSEKCSKYQIWKILNKEILKTENSKYRIQNRKYKIQNAKKREFQLHKVQNIEYTITGTKNYRKYTIQFIKNTKNYKTK